MALDASSVAPRPIPRIRSIPASLAVLVHRPALAGVMAQRGPAFKAQRAAVSPD
jgi:hypothetical protein